MKTCTSLEEYRKWGSFTAADSMRMKFLEDSIFGGFDFWKVGFLGGAALQHCDTRSLFDRGFKLGSSFWVEQRFSAAILARFSIAALR